MVQLRIDLDPSTYEALVERAGDERRPIPWQAEHMLKRTLGRRDRRTDRRTDLALAGPHRPEPDRAA